MSLNQDVDMYAAKAQHEGEKQFQTSKGRHLWLQVISGKVSVDGTEFQPGDGAGITDLASFKLKWGQNTEFILLDLP